MKKLISYSLWGDKPIYNHGFIQNYIGAKKIYKDWDVIVYHDDTIDDFVKDFIRENNIESVQMKGVSNGTFWRFLANDIPDVSHVIFRDCDSRLSIREKLAVDEWIQSEKILHVMRDHPFHRIPLGVSNMGMLAGMWGIKTGQINMQGMFDKMQIDTNIWGADQTFINDIYIKFQNDMIVHDEFFSGCPFPIARENKHFIGERIDENNMRVGEDYKLIP